MADPAKNIITLASMVSSYENQINLDKAGNPCRRETLSTVDLLVLTSLDQLLLTMQTLFTSFTK
jgi:hypothetical protein